MKVLYSRISSVTQNIDRQLINKKDYDMVIEDKCSGVIPFFDRDGGLKLKKSLEQGRQIELFTNSLDRLGRNTEDILKTIRFFTERQIPITFISQGLTTLDEKGIENPMTKMMVGILGTLSEMERTISKERQKEGIELHKLKVGYKGRKKGTEEDVLKFLSKPNNKKSLELIKKGYKSVEISKITGVSLNTLTKIKKLGIKKMEEYPF